MVDLAFIKSNVICLGFFFLGGGGGGGGGVALTIDRCIHVVPLRS